MTDYKQTARHKAWLKANPIGSGKWSEGATDCTCRGIHKCKPCAEIEEGRRRV